MTAPIHDPIYVRLVSALRARDLPGYFAAHDEIAGREALQLARLAVRPGDVLILKCQADRPAESFLGAIGHLEAALGENVRAVLLPAPCEIAVTARDGEGAAI